MKKLLIIVMTLFSFSASARELITVVYAFSPSDSLANYHRTMIVEANKIQDKYNFIFDTRPGAGGSIASNYVLTTPNTVLAHSTAFFVRPAVFPHESYDLNRFKEQYVHCVSPMAVTSSKFKSWKDIPENASIGVSGLGVTSHLIASELQKRYPKLNIVPFKSTNESMLSMIAGQTDLHIGFISEAEQWSRENAKATRNVTVLGITGTKAVNGYVPLVQQGFGQIFADMNLVNHLLVPANIDSARHKEFYKIFARASKTDSVRSAYAVDYCEPLSVDYNGLDKFFEFHRRYWKKLASQIKID
jgi:tripartite-type tricarboxylate transporter receptor subunit TctC